MVYWWAGNLANNWYREKLDFRGPAGTSTYDFGESTTPPGACVRVFSMDDRSMRCVAKDLGQCSKSS